MYAEIKKIENKWKEGRKEGRGRREEGKKKREQTLHVCMLKGYV